MALTEQDRTDITDLINRHGHLTDAGELDEAAGLFTPDVTCDLTDFGLGELRGRAAILDAARAVGDANPVGHHVTNIVLTQTGDGSVRVRSKGIGIKADGSAGSVVYDDVVTRRPDGWKISHRTISVRRTPLGGAGPREVLERLRQASVNQSADELRRVYAVDAVHEFPFTTPGQPARLTGREEIVSWIAAGWRANALRYERYRTLAVHDTADPATIVVEQEAIGRGGTGEFALPNIVVLTTRDGEVTHLRDYVDIPAAAAAIGHDL